MPRRLTQAGIALLLLGLHTWLAVSGSRLVGLTHDEPAHIVAGLYYNLTGDFRFQPENGNLPQRLQALPWIVDGTPLPEIRGPHWETADVWTLGERMIESVGERAEFLIFTSRLVTALASAALILVLYRWTRRSLGRWPALLTLALMVTCPNLLAHAGLATSDTFGTLGLWWATLAWWGLCHRITLGRIVGFGLAAGFLALSKFNCVLLPPIGLLILAARLCRPARLPWYFGQFSGRLSGGLRAPALLGAGAFAAAFTAGVIWAGYGFRYDASDNDSARFSKSWETVLMDTPQRIGLPQLGDPPDQSLREISAGPLQHCLAFSRKHRLLPEAWIYGLAFVVHHSHYRLAYLAGEYRSDGWLLYFPLALALKTTPAGLIILSVSIVTLAFVRPRRRLLRLAPAFAITLVGVTLAITSNINIGLRHILPVIVALWVLPASAASLCKKEKIRRAFLLILLICVISQSVSSLRISPHFLAYFNFLAGTRPDLWLADSNLDWGQGLPELRSWVEKLSVNEPLHLIYFGTDIPERLSIRAVRFGDHYFDRAARVFPAPLKPGWYAFGATMYHRVYSETRGPWTLQREIIYQRVLARLMHQEPPEPAVQQLLLQDFDSLRLARLVHSLHGRAPDETLAAGAMLLFHLDEKDLQRAFLEPLSNVNKVVELRLNDH